MMKKFMSILLAGVLIVGLCACSSQPATAAPENNAAQSSTGASAPAPKEAEPVVLKAGVAITPTHPCYMGIVRFDELIRKATGDRVTVELFHSGQLGNERDLVEGLSMGSVDLTETATAPITSMIPKIAVFDLPYLFIDQQQADKIMDGPVGQGFFKDMETHNIIGLSYFTIGFREITNSKRPIRTPEDMKGIKIRVMESPIPLATFGQLGANPTPMAFGEVFTALQQGTIDAQENPVSVITASKFNEVQKYLSLTDHFYSPCPFMMSKNAYDKFSSDDQKLIMDAAKEAAVYEREVAVKQNTDYIAKLQEAGMEVNEVDKAAFQKAMEPVYAKFEAELGKDLIDAIRNTK